MKYLTDSYLDSSVIIKTRLWGFRPEDFLFNSQHGQKIFFSSPLHPDWFSETHLRSRSMGTDSTFTEVKGLRCEAHHSFPFSVQVENKCGLPQLYPPPCLHGLYRNNQFISELVSFHYCNVMSVPGFCCVLVLTCPQFAWTLLKYYSFIFVKMIYNNFVKCL